MKKNIIAVMTLLLSVGALQNTLAQDKPGVGIGQKKVDKSAILDISSNTKGLLIPRVALTSLTDFGLTGGTNTESMLVYNTTANTDLVKGFHYWDGSKWELITSESRLTTLITELETKINERIDNITNFGDDADKSFLVVFNPDDKDIKKGTFSYLEPVLDPTTKKITGYNKKEISLEELVQGSETNTFFREIKKDLPDANGATQTGVVVSYIYFSESVIKKWLKDNDGRTYDDALIDIPDALGQPIDVESIISSTFIQNLDTYAEYIKNIIYKTEGSLKLTGDAGNYVFERTKDDGTVEPINFNDMMETQTSIGKSTVDSNGDLSGFNVDTALPTSGLEGEIYYQYTTETQNGAVKNYINLTEDIKYSVIHNDDLRQEITNITNKVENGSNVYFGKIGGQGDDLLFTIDDQGVETPIDISQNIINSILNEENVQNTILQVTRVDIADKHDKYTNTNIEGKKLYKGIQTVTITEDYASNFPNALSIFPQKEIGNAPNGDPIYGPDTSIEIGRVLSVEVLDSTGAVVVNTVTDLTFTSNTFNFSFGQGIMYTSLLKGTYTVIYEYVQK